MDEELEAIKADLEAGRKAALEFRHAMSRKRAADEPLTPAERKKVAAHVGAGDFTLETLEADTDVYRQAAALSLTADQLAGLQATADALASEGAGLDAEKKEFDESFGPHVAEHRDRMIQATRAVNAAKVAAEKHEQLQREHPTLFGRDLDAERRRRHLVQVCYARPKNSTAEIIEFENLMSGPSGWNLAQLEGFEFIAVEGQSADELADLRARAVALIRGGKRAYYLAGKTEPDFARRDCVLWGIDAQRFDTSAVSFQLLPGQSAEDLAARVAGIEKACKEARRNAKWDEISSPAALSAGGSIMLSRHVCNALSSGVRRCGSGRAPDQGAPDLFKV